MNEFGKCWICSKESEIFRDGVCRPCMWKRQERQANPDYGKKPISEMSWNELHERSRELRTEQADLARQASRLDFWLYVVWGIFFVALFWPI